jgi:calcineurin-like phosphoesterase family protein
MPVLTEFTSEPVVGWAGDWHGNTGWALHALRTLASRNVKVVYHVGDFGLWGGQDGASYLRKIYTLLNARNMILIITPGNHENYDMLERFTLNEEGFLFRHDVNRIWFAPRGHIWLHGEANMGSLGGTGSIDYRQRTLGKSWWIQEAITSKDVDTLRFNFLSSGLDNLDVMMTHDSPSGVDVKKSRTLNEPDLDNYLNHQRILVRNAVDVAAPRTLVHGHWHIYITDTIEGVNESMIPYDTNVIGLDMDDTSHNMMIGNIEPGVGITNTEILYR